MRFARAKHAHGAADLAPTFEAEHILKQRRLPNHQHHDRRTSHGPPAHESAPLHEGGMHPLPTLSNVNPPSTTLSSADFRKMFQTWSRGRPGVMATKEMQGPADFTPVSQMCPSGAWPQGSRQNTTAGAGRRSRVPVKPMPATPSDPQGKPMPAQPDAGAGRAQSATRPTPSPPQGWASPGPQPPSKPPLPGQRQKTPPAEGLGHTASFHVPQQNGNNGGVRKPASFNLNRRVRSGDPSTRLLRHKLHPEGLEPKAQPRRGSVRRAFQAFVEPSDGQSASIHSASILSRLWMRHEVEYGAFVQDPPDVIFYSDVPWPDYAEPDDLLVHTLTTSQQTEPVAGHRGLIRTLALRWHPDKFQQAFGARLAATDKDRIMDRVTKTFQLISRSK